MKMNLDDKLEKIDKWRQFSTLLFVIMLASILTGSVVAAVVKVPKVVSPLMAVVIVPLGSIWKWVNSKWRKCSSDLRKERDIFNAMHIRIDIASQQLANIAVIFERLHIQNKDLSFFDHLAEMDNGETSTSVLTDKSQTEKERLLGALKLCGEMSETPTQDEDLSTAFEIYEEMGDNVVAEDVMEDVRRMVADFVETINDLGVHVNKCGDETKTGRKLIFHLIINHHDQGMDVVFP